MTLTPDQIFGVYKTYQTSQHVQYQKMNRIIRVEAGSLVFLFKCRSPAVSADFNSTIPWHVRCESSDQQASHVTIFSIIVINDKAQRNY